MPYNLNVIKNLLKEKASNIRVDFYLILVRPGTAKLKRIRFEHTPLNLNNVKDSETFKSILKQIENDQGLIVSIQGVEFGINELKS